MKYKKLLLILVISFVSVVYSGSKQKQGDVNRTTIVNQKIKKRIYFEAVPELVKKINFEISLDSTIYKPDFCTFDKSGNIFVIDYSTFYIHKFSLSNDTKGYKHSYFGNGKGKGPGEFINPTDFDIYKGKIYITDPANGCIEVYSTNGKYLERINLSNNIVPERTVILNDNIVVCSQGYCSASVEI